MYKDKKCKITYAGHLFENLGIKTRVVLLMVIDWNMKTISTGRNNGIQWTLWTQMDNLNLLTTLVWLQVLHSQDWKLRLLGEANVKTMKRPVISTKTTKYVKLK